MTLAGFMRGGGGSTNMRLSRRHCWLASRVAQQQQQTIQQQALQFASCCCCWTTEAGEGGGCTQGSIPCLPLLVRSFSLLNEYFVIQLVIQIDKARLSLICRKDARERQREG